MQVWPRILEIVLGCWLLMSPFVFGHHPEEPSVWINEMVCGALVIVVSSMSISRRFFRLYLVNIPIALWLIGHAYFQIPPPAHAPPWLQNDLITGMLLGMMAIIPSDTSRPPREWQEFDLGTSENREKEARSGK